MKTRAFLVAALFALLAAIQVDPAAAADVNVGGGAGLTIGIGSPDWRAGEDAAQAARAQGQAQRYTQYIQLSTQLMGELQSTERELVDLLQTMKRDTDNMGQSYSALRDNAFRTDERLMTTR